MCKLIHTVNFYPHCITLNLLFINWSSIYLNYLFYHTNFFSFFLQTTQYHNNHPILEINISVSERASESEIESIHQYYINVNNRFICLADPVLLMFIKDAETEQLLSFFVLVLSLSLTKDHPHICRSKDDLIPHSISLHHAQSYYTGKDAFAYI